MISYSSLHKSTSLQCPSTMVGGICPNSWQWVQPCSLLWSVDVHRYKKRLEEGLCVGVCSSGPLPSPWELPQVVLLGHIEPNHVTPGVITLWVIQLPWLPDMSVRKTHKSHWNFVAINNWCSPLFYPFLCILMSLKVDNWLRGNAA